MTRICGAHLVATLNSPGDAARLAPAQWSALIACARAANLAGLLAERVLGAAVPLPAAVARHLEAINQLGRRQTRSVAWEVHGLQRALGNQDIPVVLLKGAAYAMSGHAVSRGRLFGDIDILVPREALGNVETRLMVAGWTSAKTTSYDQRYYRTWMHELPPMLNVRRGTVLDVHHTILPLTSRHTPDARLIIDAASPLPGLPSIRIPQAEHLLIHSIVHLVHEGEMHNGLRDLFDIDGLLRTGAREPGYWEQVIDSASELGLAGPVWLGLLLAQRLIGSPVPSTVLAALKKAGEVAVASPLVIWLYRQAIRPENEAAKSVTATLARLAIYVRAHWLRMPAHLLARHLAHKSLTRLRKNERGVAGRG